MLDLYNKQYNTSDNPKIQKAQNKSIKRIKQNEYRQRSLTYLTNNVDKGLK